jgi:Protein of unknown function (DUF1203)
MAYRIEGLPIEDFAPLFMLDEAALAQKNARRVIASADAGFPCRVSLCDATAGERLILLHHVSHDVATPYRSAYAIYVREAAQQADPWVDRIPPVFAGRPIALRGFDPEGMLRDARLALPGQADEQIRTLFGNESVGYIHAHNAAHGCFSARIDRC